MNYWRDAPSTPISNLRIGDAVKVIGTLSSPTDIAPGGHYESGQGYKWFWNTTDLFSVAQTQGSIPVLTGHPFQIMPGLHLPSYVEVRSPTWGYVMPSVYLNGDEAAVVGHSRGLLRCPRASGDSHCAIRQSICALSGLDRFCKDNPGIPPRRGGRHPGASGEPEARP